MLLSSSPELLHSHVEFLSSIRPFRNYKNIHSLNEAADYIKDVFSNYSGNIHEQIFSVENNEYRNIIASFNTLSEKRIIIGAHYDVAGDTPGADDNGSGVAGLLEIARILSIVENKLPLRVDLAAYSLEEPPFFGTEHMGSFIHAKYLKENKVNVEVMICLEMIGYFSDEENSQKYPLPLFKLFYPTKGNFIGVVGKIGQKKITEKIKKLMESNSNISIFSANLPSIIPGVDLSDHRNFWHFGFNAVMVTDTAFYRNPNYHKRTDTVNTLDFERMSQVINGVINVCLNF